MNRRHFITSSSALLAAPLIFQQCRGKRSDSLASSETVTAEPYIKPIVGSWFEFEHHNQAEGIYWNPALRQFTAEQWKAKIKEIHDIGFEYLVLLAVAYEGKTYYPSALQPRHDYACEDPLEAVLSAADECGIKFFISNDYWSDWTQVEKAMSDEAIWKLREKGMEEFAAKYSHHKSFYGWYYPNETEIHGIFDDLSINYANRCTAKAKSLTPGCRTMIAPYGTRSIKYDDRYVRQLEQLDVDIIAYQDEVGVRKTPVGTTGQYYESLYTMHVKAGRSRLWADVEIFEFEGEVYKSALLPAPSERVFRQLADITPFVENILVYQYLGMMNRPGTAAFAGHKDSERLYSDYVRKFNIK
ncbi:MAG: DUF4434 domain-containing protein [Tannerella sp.]|jgi:hypothetical protein|nr:DUF4434 domain-containing protein [Tannerella sp.]